jgi:peptide/nickel transport system permease protein
VAGYITRRVLAMFGMLIALSMVTFFMFSVVPADPARLSCGKTCTPQIIQANRELYGLDKPTWQQYTDFAKGLVVGRTYGSGPTLVECPAPCLGYSFVQQANVTDMIITALPVTINLAIGAFILMLVVGISVGVISALRRGTLVDRSSMAAALFFYSFPVFFIGLVLLYFVKIKWRIIPATVEYAPIYENPVAYFQVMILPWITVALLYAAFYSRLTRNQMLETLGEDFIRTARAKGLPERVVIRKHAFRAGLTPIVTAAGLDLAGLLGGAVITETIFRLNGMGRLAIQAVEQTDLPVVAGTVLVAAVFVIVANLIVDLLYAVIDPRVRLT